MERNITGSSLPANIKCHKTITFRPSYAGLDGHILFLGSRQISGENQQNREKSAVFRLKKENFSTQKIWQGWSVKNAEKKIILTLYTPPEIFKDR